MPARVPVALAAVVATVAACAACSNGTPPVNRRPHPGSTTATVVNGFQRVEVVATDTYRFDPSTITVHPGRVEIDLTNIGKGAPHNWSLPIASATTALASAGRTESVVFTAPAPGRYTFVCTIHVRQGQTGTLVVLDH